MDVPSLGGHFAGARAAAQQAAGHQQYPAGTLYVVATPIGNLADISLRALHVLGLVDGLACEDTRHTRQMLNVYGIDTPAQGLLALHQHNEQAAAQQVIVRLQAGERWAFVSDAGTPAVSDPGARLVAAVRAAGLRVLPLPGASSVTTLLSAAGVLGEGGFEFVGFLSSKAQERQTQVQRLATLPHTLVLLEAPHRIEALARDLAALGDRPVTIGRELTKQFEQIDTVPAADLPAWFAADAQRLRGEFALVLHVQTRDAGDDDAAQHDRLLRLLLAELPTKTAVKLAADISGAPRNALYARALQLKDDAAP